MTKTIVLNLESEERRQRSNTVLSQCSLPKALMIFHSPPYGSYGGSSLAIPSKYLNFSLSSWISLIIRTLAQSASLPTLECRQETHIERQYVRIHWNWVDEQRRAAVWTELVHASLQSKLIVLDQIFALDEDKVLLLRVDIEVAILATNGTIAAHDLLAIQRRKLDFVLDGCTMTVSFIPHF